MASDGVAFVDTNVLVDTHDRSETRKQPVAQAVLEALWQARTGTLSTQVLQACYVVATRKFDPPMRSAAARELVALCGEWPIVQVDVALILAASKLE
jgi:predicted nucleic acid-binding protein